MEKTKKTDTTKEGSMRRLKVNAVYGEVPLVECMKNIMKGKITRE